MPSCRWLAFRLTRELLLRTLVRLRMALPIWTLLPRWTLREMPRPAAERSNLPKDTLLRASRTREESLTVGARLPRGLGGRARALTARSTPSLALVVSVYAWSGFAKLDASWLSGEVLVQLHLLHLFAPAWVTTGLSPSRTTVALCAPRVPAKAAARPTATTHADLSISRPFPRSSLIHNAVPESAPPPPLIPGLKRRCRVRPAGRW
jgi:hypothetical protein